jgi:hypothetical protein
VTEAELKAEAHYYETLDLAALVGKMGDDPHELLMKCTNALANLRFSLIEHYSSQQKEKLH